MSPTDRYHTDRAYKQGYDAFCAGERRNRMRSTDWLTGYDTAARDASRTE